MMTTAVRVFWIEGTAPGRLGLMARPRGGDWLEDEITALRSTDVDVIVSLLERSEVRELDIQREQELCEAHGMTFLSHPIKDRSVPLSNRDALAFARQISVLVHDGKSVVIHCRQGVGRSALMAACVLALNGVSVTEAFDRIERCRGCRVPDTDEQRQWVARFADRAR